jgi:hypothetical protein
VVLAQTEPVDDDPVARAPHDPDEVDPGDQALGLDNARAAGEGHAVFEVDARELHVDLDVALAEGGVGDGGVERGGSRGIRGAVDDDGTEHTASL